MEEDSDEESEEVHYIDESDSHNCVDEVKLKIQRQKTMKNMSKIRQRFYNVLLHDADRRQQDKQSSANVLVPPTLSQEDIHNLSAAPVNLDKYFGPNARMDFYNKMSNLYQEVDIEGPGLQGAFDQTAFLPCRGVADIPFLPRRPVKKENLREKVSVESIDDDVSSLDGCDDRLQQHDVSIDALSTICSFDHEMREDYEHFQSASPRTTFISGCIQQNIPPRASLLLRKNVSKTLDLQHQGK